MRNHVSMEWEPTTPQNRWRLYKGRSKEYTVGIPPKDVTGIRLVFPLLFTGCTLAEGKEIAILSRVTNLKSVAWVVWRCLRPFVSYVTNHTWWFLALKIATLWLFRPVPIDRQLVGRCPYVSRGFTSPNDPSKVQVIILDGPVSLVVVQLNLTVA